MAVNQKPLVNEEIYHIVLRSVGDTVIFNDKNDYYRGIFCLYEFNNAFPIEIRKRREQRKKEKTSGCQTPADKRDKLVDIFVFSFMPNHIHLLLKQIKNNGITDFMKKVGGGYANYFNKKHKRIGHLFNHFGSIHIETDNQLKNVFVYIHTNPSSLIEPGWKEKGIKNLKNTIEFLENYRWSSYQDYLGKKNFPSVTQRDFILEIMGGIEGCKAEVDNWIMYKKEMRDFGDIILE